MNPFVCHSDSLLHGLRCQLLLRRESKGEREFGLRSFSMTSRQRKLKTAIRWMRQSLTCPASGMKALHNFMASGVQASCCSGVPSVPWLNAAEVTMLKAALRKTAPMAKRLMRRSNTPRIGDPKSISRAVRAVDESRRDIHSAALTRRRSYSTGQTAGAGGERLRTVSVMSVSKLDCSLATIVCWRWCSPRRSAEKNNGHIGNRNFFDA